MTSKTFFVNLKETCRKIDSDVNSIKEKLISRHQDNEEEIAAKKIREIQDKIVSLKTDAVDLKNTLGPKLAHTGVFIKNFKELMAETEVSISKKEEYLKQYGYIPVESAPEVTEITVKSSETPEKKVKEDCLGTPKLLDYGISSYTLETTPVNQKSSISPDFISNVKSTRSHTHSDSTPTLDIAAIVPASKPKETPPLPEPFYTPAKETPPLPGHCSYSSVNLPSTPKLTI